MAETWRDELKQLLPTTQERSRISRQTGISTRTLERWMMEDTKPNFAALERVIEQFPQQREHLIVLIQQEYGDFQILIQTDDAHKHIPAPFYARIIETYNRVAEPLRFWTITNMIFEQLLPQLDPHRQGVELMLIQCTRPKIGNPIRSLYENISIGTPPWSSTVAHRIRYLGSESLSGYVVSSCEPAIKSREEGNDRVPVSWEEHEQSVAAFPLQRAGWIAGCLGVTSTQPRFFTDDKQTLLYHYANLLVLALTLEDFYAQEHIQLYKMPELSQQEPLLLYFSRRVSSVVEERKITRFQAEHFVRQEIEEELIRNHAPDPLIP